MSQFDLLETSVMLLSVAVASAFVCCREAKIDPMNCKGEKNTNDSKVWDQVQVSDKQKTAVCSSNQEVIFEYVTFNHLQ